MIFVRKWAADENILAVCPEQKQCLQLGPGQPEGALYLTLDNDDDDTHIRATLPTKNANI